MRRDTAWVVSCCGLLLFGAIAAPLTAQVPEPATEPTAIANEAATKVAGRAETSKLVEWSGKRVPYADVPAVSQKNKFFAEYEKLRSGMLAERVETHWTLAQFCGKHGLKEQQRAHLLAVIAREPNHLEAREALNHKQIDGMWLSPAEQKAHNAEKVAAVEAGRRWETPLSGSRST